MNCYRRIPELISQEVGLFHTGPGCYIIVRSVKNIRQIKVFVAEALGAKVEWDAVARSVVITTVEKQQPYRFLKLNGEQTPWLYWEVDNKLYVEINNIRDMIKMRYPMALASLTYSQNLLVVDNRNFTLPVRTFENFEAAPLDYINMKSGMLDFEWDSASGNLRLK